MSSASIGEKIRYFRKRANLSQLDLELEINASPGSISRIESGKVNPTKETLVKTIHVLQLTKLEASQLLSIPDLPPNEQQVLDAISEFDSVIDDKSISYLIDDWFRFWAASPGLQQFLGLPRELIDEAKGRNILLLILDPDFGVRNKLDSEFALENLSLETARVIQELKSTNRNDLLAETLAEARKFTGFDQILKLSKEMEKDTASAGARVSYLNLNGNRLRMNHGRERLKKNQYFEIIELFNPQPF